MGRRVDEVDSVEQDAPAGRLFEAADHPQRRGLAAARGAEEREELTGFDHQVDVVDGDEIAELLAQRGELDPTAMPDPASRTGVSCVDGHRSRG